MGPNRARDGKDEKKEERGALAEKRRLHSPR